MKKLAGVGACVLDTVVECPAYPREDAKTRANRVIRRGGGPAANALAAAAVLGARATYLGTMPADTDGDFLVGELRRYGVDFKGPRVDAAPFTSIVLLSAASGTRTCVFDRGGLPDDPQALALGAIDGADILHLDGNFLNCALAAARYAKGRGIPVSLDAGGLYEGIEALLPLVDILIPSAEFARTLTGRADIPSAMQDLHRRYAPQILVVTDGANGGYRYDGGAARYPAFPVEVKDSNGAGDVFHGAFLAALCDGLPVESCCAFASAASALKCTGLGVKESLPDKRTVAAFMKKRGHRLPAR